MSSFLERPPGPLLTVRAEDDLAAHGSHMDVVASDFRSTERFSIVRRLGAGGMGVVYEVHDRVRDEVVALKTLLHRSRGTSG